MNLKSHRIGGSRRSHTTPVEIVEKPTQDVGSTKNRAIFFASPHSLWLQLQVSLSWLLRVMLILVEFRNT